MQAALNQAVQALMSGGTLPPGCVIMAIPYPQAPQMIPQYMMNSPIAGPDPMIYSQQQQPYYGPSPYTAVPPSHGVPPQQNYNYPIVPYKGDKNSKKKPQQHQQPHPDIYNSTSFDSYMDGLSWSRMFDHRSHKNSKQRNHDHASINYDKKSNSSKKQRSNSGSSSSSTTSDETIRRVNVSTNPPLSHTNSKQQTKGTLPFKYSSEFVPGAGKQQQPQKIKSNDVFFVKKPSN
jgi:hypothetical protein